MVRFNEDIFNEIREQENALKESQDKTSSLLSRIVQRLEENDIQHEKLSILRKFQKQKEKRQILREKIESENA
jgi:arginyl-tRNA--protein-N-Asp/Glu arginylyltransferase